MAQTGDLTGGLPGREQGCPVGTSRSHRHPPRQEQERHALSNDLVPLVQPGAELYPLLAVSGGRYSAMGGGVPLTSEDEVIAGVGVSGGTTEQDIAIVEAAVS